MEPGFDFSGSYVKNNVEYKIDNDEKLVPDNWREIADMRLMMLDKGKLLISYSIQLMLIRHAKLYAYRNILRVLGREFHEY
jgi:hypothetical protein